jgi:predicted nucleic acid-binding protein
MNVIVDTAVWSLALRRHSPDQNQEIIRQLQDLIQSDQILMLGVIRQEILSGIKNVDQFNRLRNTLRSFPDFDIHSEDYEKAAEFFNICRQKGIQGSNTDFLICAVAHRCQSLIFTTDRDFHNFQPHIPVCLYA